MKQLKGVGIGAGYFSGFQYEAWNRIPGVEISALCNRDTTTGKHLQQQYGIPRHYTNWKEMLEEEAPDFVDIITPPNTHLEMCKAAADMGIHIICQKPLAPTFNEAIELVEYVHEKPIRFMVHENWRFQPWYRAIKQLIGEKTVGDIHTMIFRNRMGDGWGRDAYLNRQPYFRDYPRLLIYENGIHFIDTYRYLGGEIRRVFAHLRKMNPVIRGEDWGMVHFEFENDLIGLWDASRYNEPVYPKPRYTFGEFLLDGYNGSIRLYGDGRLTVHRLGQTEASCPYEHRDINFAGDCVYATQRHFVDCLRNDKEFETNGPEYLRSLAVQEAIYQSARDGMPVEVKYA